MAQDVREPKQERSIEKKNRIVQAGFELFSQVGYYNTNTVEIAKRAGVSTGIVYGYFKDKRDILLDVLEIYVKEAFAPVLDMINGLTAPVNFEDTIKHVLDGAIEIHKKYANIHGNPMDFSRLQNFLRLLRSCPGSRRWKGLSMRMISSPIRWMHSQGM